MGQLRRGTADMDHADGMLELMGEDVHDALERLAHVE